MAEEKDGGKEDKDATREATDAFKSLIGRVGEIFGIFDLSFFVAGAVCLGALVFGAGLLGGEGWIERAEPVEWKAVHIGALVLACYVLGLICFAAGRSLRQNARFYGDLPGHLRDFGLLDRYARFLPGEGAPPEEVTRRSALLYTRLWAEARQAKDLAPSFNLIMRYWIMAALCDGLSAALVVWEITWVAWTIGAPPIPRLAMPIMILVAAAIGLAIWLCRKEAARYSRYQMYELVATIAHYHEGRDTAPRPRSSSPPAHKAAIAPSAGSPGRAGPPVT